MASEISPTAQTALARHAPRRRAVIVAGMHRSGTSAISRILGLAGMQLPATPMGSNSANRLGHWGESARIYALHQELYDSVGASWQDLEEFPAQWFGSSQAASFRQRMVDAVADEFPGEDPFVLKDPRICVLLPFWQEVLEQVAIAPGFVLPIRNPMEVAASLARRDGLPHAHGIMLWLQHTLAAERGTRKSPRVLVSYDGLLTDRRPVLERIETELGIAMTADADDQISDFLLTGERHHRFSRADLIERRDIPDWVKDTYELLEAGCESNAPLDHARLDAIAADVAIANRAYGPLLASAEADDDDGEAAAGDGERQAGLDRIAAHEAANAELAARVAALEAELAARSEALDAEISAGSKPRRVGLRRDRSATPASSGSTSAAQQAPGASRLRTARQLASLLRPSPLRGLRRLREYSALRRSPEFDRGFYLRRNPDVANAGMNPIVHYLRHGARAGLDPSPTFSTSGYLRAHADVAAAGTNPLYAYLRGKRNPRTQTDGASPGDDDEHPHPHPAIAKPLGGESPVALAVTEEVRAKARQALSIHPLTVSVVVPTHNRAEQLEAALRSAFAQSYAPLEVIVCDDGGDDRTPEMIEGEFADELASGRLKLLRHEQRRGSSAARNTAMAAAQGDLLAYLDSDNRWQPDFLLIMAGRLADGDDISTAYCGLRMHDDGGAEPTEIFDPFDREQLLTRNYIDVNSLVHRRRVYEQLGGFDEELTRLVDWDLSLRYTGNYPPVAVPHCLVDYYGGRQGGRISHTQDFDANAERIRRRFAHQRLQAGVAPLRLAYVLWDYPALSQTFVLTEIEQLLGDGHDIHVYFHTAPDRSAEIEFSVPTFEVADAAELAELLREHGRTLVHSHFAYPAANRLAWPAAQTAGIPFTFTVHAVDIFHAANRERNQLAEMAADELCARVFAIGEFHRGFLIEQGVAANKISIARPAARLHPAPGAAVQARLQRERRVVGCVTRFVAKKGLDDLIRAAALLGDGVELRLHGYGPQEAELRELAAELGAANVHFAGPLERGRLASALEEIDLFVLPCVVDEHDDMDGLPTVIGEAMAAGIPVMTTDVAAIGEVVVDGTTGFLVEPRNPEQLAGRIAEVLAMTAGELEPVLRAAGERAAETWDPGRTADVLLDSWQRPPVEIALVTHSRFEDDAGATTAEIIRRIYELTSTPFALRIVDNDSDDAYRSALAAAIAGKANASLTLLDRNVHWGPALNLALRAARSDQLIYVCSNEGFVLRLGWERRLLDYMRANRNVAMAGHLVSSPGFPTGADYIQEPWFAGFRNKWFAERSPEREFAHVQGGIFVLRRSAYERCGGFSERTAQAAADVEYSYYLESLGWDLGEIDGVPSVTKKTLPRLDAHLDERVVAAHPLTLASVEKASLVANGEGAYCNVCAWRGGAFEPGELCPSCRSSPFGRLLFRFLADSPWPFRGLDALVAIDDERVMAELQRMFELSARASRDLARGELGLRDIVIADLSGVPAAEIDSAVGAIGDALRIDGVAIVGLAEPASGATAGAKQAFAAAGYATNRVLLHSSAVRFSAGGLLVAQHGPVSQPAPTVDG